MGQAIGFTVCHNAVIDRLKEHFSGIIRPQAIGKALYDITDYVYQNGIEYGIWLEFSGGEKETSPVFRRNMWTWTMEGVVLMRYTGDDTSMEERLSTMVDSLFDTFATPNHAITDITPYVQIPWIGKPDAVAIEDTPFYFLPFIIKIIDDRGG